MISFGGEISKNKPVCVKIVLSLKHKDEENYLDRDTHSIMLFMSGWRQKKNNTLRSKENHHRADKTHMAC
jgi:hypothetical protein